MCDTQVIRQGGITYFAKNSDRESSEPQFICRFDDVRGDQNKTLQTTYLTVPQIPNRFGLILSKPNWIWGAEMGINTQGVVIGNEAVFTKEISKTKKALLGMDLVRLGLERGGTALDALNIITALLEEFGQGGPAGYRDKSSRYDNSFIITDANETWILETAGQHWVAKKVQAYAAISNTLSIGSDYDLSSTGLLDYARSKGYYHSKTKDDFRFAKAFSTKFMPFMAKAKARQEHSLNCLASQYEKNTASLESMIANLRQHKRIDMDSPQHNLFAAGSNHDICMHGAGLTRPSQTCGSMVVALQTGQKAKILVTGTSAPCLSIFKPIGFQHDESLSVEHTTKMSGESSIWHDYEWVHRRALKDSTFRQTLINSRNEMESKLLSCFSDNITVTEANILAEKWHSDWQQKAQDHQAALCFNPLNPYDRYWKKLNRLDGIQWR